MEKIFEKDFSKLSIEDRVSHNNWKARLSGYEELARLFPQLEEKEFIRYSLLVKKFVVDSNAIAQEKGLTASLVFVDHCPNVGKYIRGIVAGVVTKCLASTRPKAIETAQEIILVSIEIGKQEIVIEELIKALEQKSPKNVSAAIYMLRKCLNQFGNKVISTKPVISVLMKFLNDRDPIVREEARHLTIELYRWVKDVLIESLGSLKSIHFDELKAEFEKLKNQNAKPERFLRSQRSCSVEITNCLDACQQTNNQVDSVAVPEENDSFELLEPVDILTKLPSDFFTSIESKNWIDRKNGLEKLQKLLISNPKLVAKANFKELIKPLKKIVCKDPNVVVATIAIKSIGHLAKGLRKCFHSYANSCISILLEKFKEKKVNVVQATREAIDVVYFSTSLEMIQENLVDFLCNKNPSIRSETALFLARCFAQTNPSQINKKLLETLVIALLKTLNDSDSTVRESSAEALGAALKAQGNRNMFPLLQGLEPFKMNRVQEFCAKTEIKNIPTASISSEIDFSKTVLKKNIVKISKSFKPNTRLNDALKNFSSKTNPILTNRLALESKIVGQENKSQEQIIEFEKSDRLSSSQNRIVSPPSIQELKKLDFNFTDLKQDEKKTSINSFDSSELNHKLGSSMEMLSSVELEKALQAFKDLNRVLKQRDSNFNLFLETKINQIIILCNKQYWSIFSNHYQMEMNSTEPSTNKNEKITNSENPKQQAERLFCAVSSVLNKIFTCPLGKKVSRDTLRELITHLLTYFVEMKSHQLIFNSVNYLMGVVLNGSDSTNLFSALIRMLHDYVNNAVAVPADHTEKFLELTMKFLWRVTKWLDQYLPDLSIDEIILETHLFFKSYPRQWWKVNNQDGLPLRTIKTLVYFIVEKKGDSILDHFTLIQNKDESQVWHQIQKALHRYQKQ